MKLGILSDAHGNYPGLAACIAALDRAGAESLVFLGDACGYLPDSAGVLDLLTARQVRCVLGNHDAMLLGRLPVAPEREAVYRLGQARASLSRRSLAAMEAWPLCWELEVAGDRMLGVHGSPASPLEGYVYPDSDLSAFGQREEAVIFMGHTHRPFMARAGSTQIVNVGSCGLPRDSGEWASCVLFNTADGAVQILRVPIDTGALIRKYRDQIHPQVRAVLERRSATPVTGILLPG